MRHHARLLIPCGERGGRHQHREEGVEGGNVLQVVCLDSLTPAAKSFNCQRLPIGQDEDITRLEGGCALGKSGVLFCRGSGINGLPPVAREEGMLTGETESAAIHKAHLAHMVTDRLLHFEHLRGLLLSCGFIEGEDGLSRLHCLDGTLRPIRHEDGGACGEAGAIVRGFAGRRGGLARRARRGRRAFRRLDR